MDIISKIKIWGMKKKIMANPFIGTKDEDGMFQYKEGRFTIKYAISYAKTPEAKNIPQWISVKIKRPFHKNIIKKMGEELADFWHYQKWLILFHPSTIAVLIFIGVIVYFGAIEFQPGKGYITRWLASRAIGVSPDAIEYKGDGWISVSGDRITAVDRKREPFCYDVNFFRWLVFNDAGSVRRYREQEYGSVIHPVGYDDTGEVYLKKESKLQRGEIKEGAVEWDKAQGTGIRKGKVKGHVIETTEGKLEVRDK